MHVDVKFLCRTSIESNMLSCNSLHSTGGSTIDITISMGPTIELLEARLLWVQPIEMLQLEV
jgi:hypothetical protein